MCTLTWWRKDAAYGLFFNRDESFKRGAALPPVIRDGGACRYICPLDPDGGGTWVWVNEAGIIGSILNNYSARVAVRHPVSRGLLLMSLADLRHLGDIESAVARLDCSRYRGFYLFLFDGNKAVLYSWDGVRLNCSRGEHIPVPLTTSGFRPGEVVAYRQDLWRRSRQWQLLGGPDDRSDRERLERYHCWHDPDFPAYSPLMVRAGSRTVSISRITAAADGISFNYRAVDNLRLVPFDEVRMETGGRKEIGGHNT